MTDNVWNDHKEHEPLRHLYTLYRFLRRHSRLLRVISNFFRLSTWTLFKHRVALEWSFLINRAELRRRLRRAGVRQNHRQVIAISQVVHFGDIVACEPVVRQIRRQNPKSFIIFALYHGYRELMDVHPEIDHVLPVACVTEWARFAISGLFDVIIDLNIDGRTCEICGRPWYKTDGNRGVTTENYYNLGNLLEAYCKSAGFSAPANGPWICQRREDKEFADWLNLPERFVVLHAGSNEKERELPLVIWKTVILHINNHWRLPVVEIGLKPLALSLNDIKNRSLCGQLSILQSAEVIRRCALFLGTDSGPTHLANATGAYSIIALGDYRHFRRYMPYSGDYAKGERCELLYHDGPVAEMPVVRMLEAIDRRLSSLTDSG